MTQEFTATRTMLANNMATAGAELLEYMGTAGALAAIPDTDPQQYVVAGTLEIIGKLLPAVEQGAPAAYGQWTRVAERLPANGEAVLVMADSWERPAVLVYGDQPYQRFVDRRSGLWFWYPERMHWMPLPNPPEAASNENSQRGSEA